MADKSTETEYYGISPYPSDDLRKRTANRVKTVTACSAVCYFASTTSASTKGTTGGCPTNRDADISGSASNSLEAWAAE